MLVSRKQMRKDITDTLHIHMTSIINYLFSYYLQYLICSCHIYLYTLFKYALINTSMYTHIYIYTVFNFDNKIDFTDAGMAKAKAQRYIARKEKGEIPSKEKIANLDPYRW